MAPLEISRLYKLFAHRSYGTSGKIGKLIERRLEILETTAGRRKRGKFYEEDRYRYQVGYRSLHAAAHRRAAEFYEKDGYKYAKKPSKRSD